LIARQDKVVVTETTDNISAGPTVSGGQSERAISESIVQAQGDETDVFIDLNDSDSDSTDCHENNIDQGNTSNIAEFTQPEIIENDSVVINLDDSDSEVDDTDL
jgi:hypothetical protein